MRNEAWDCDPFAEVEIEALDEGLDEESDDWQVLVLDRFGDRLVANNRRFTGYPELERSW